MALARGYAMARHRLALVQIVVSLCFYQGCLALTLLYGPRYTKTYLRAYADR